MEAVGQGGRGNGRRLIFNLKEEMKRWGDREV